MTFSKTSFSPLRALGVASVVTLTACSAGEFRDDDLPASAESAIVGGSVSAADPAVFQLKTVTPVAGGSSISGCTATLVTPKVLVTAAHCIEDATASSVAWVNNTTTPSSSLPSKETGWRRVAELKKHPKYPQRYINYGYDCAVLVLDEPAVGITPKPYRKTPLTDGLGRTARIVGYGNTNGTAGTGSGTKRELATKIKEVRDGVLTIGKRGAVSCQGDSGGPAFVDEGGVETIAGISSYGDIGCVESGSYSRTELCAAFFDQFTAQACVPECVGKVCGPDGCGGVCGSCEAGKACADGQCVPTPTRPSDGRDDDGKGTSSGCVESEPNNFLGSKNRLCPDGTVSGTLASTDDTDFFVVDIPAGAVYDVTFVSADPSMRLTLYKETGDSFFGWDGGAARRVYQKTPTGGRYYVKTYGAVGPYTLRADVRL